MDAYEKRQQSKTSRGQYRDKARSMLEAAFSGSNYTPVSVTPHASVVEDADKTGAFVECTIFVPRQISENVDADVPVPF